MKPLFLSCLLILRLIAGAQETGKGNSISSEPVPPVPGDYPRPEFKTTSGQNEVIERVIAEMKGNYGGTLVTEKGPHPAIDHPAFLARYLREFAAPGPGEGMHEYDYRFERILARASSYPVMMDDARLDRAVWWALLRYESFADSNGHFEEIIDGEKVLHSLDSAQDMAWMYLNHHRAALHRDGDRLKMWIARLAGGLYRPEDFALRGWLLLHLCSFADRPEAPEAAVTRKGDKSFRTPSSLDPFLIMEKDGPAPPFTEALTAMAKAAGLTFEVWGIDPAKMPKTRILTMSLEWTKWPTDRSSVVGQESWSAPESSPYDWKARSFHPVGRRAFYGNVSPPADIRRDGVFFHVSGKRMYVWPKAQMEAGVIQMLRTRELIYDQLAAEMETRGFPKLAVTASGP